MKKLKEDFNKGDREEPFIDREYVEETNRVYDVLIEGIGDEPNSTDKAIFDIVNEIFIATNK